MVPVETFAEVRAFKTCACNSDSPTALPSLDDLWDSPACHWEAQTWTRRGKQAHHQAHSTAVGDSHSSASVLAQAEHRRRGSHPIKSLTASRLRIRPVIRYREFMFGIAGATAKVTQQRRGGDASECGGAQCRDSKELEGGEDVSAHGVFSQTIMSTVGSSPFLRCFVSARRARHSQRPDARHRPNDHRAIFEGAIKSQGSSDAAVAYFDDLHRVVQSVVVVGASRPPPDRDVTLRSIGLS
ncbi:hypothetical protein B0H12DRAFT_1235786 [Mycena haematopus]|nr:hypothetical protein B0H12DRAFT_1235786 [Mycena haematopus]